MRNIFLVTALAVAMAACHGSDYRTQVSTDSRNPSVARLWNEVLLEGIRSDYARPTVHARNLWHISAAMYDAWAAYDDVASTWLLGHTQASYACGFASMPIPRDIQRSVDLGLW